MSKRKAFIVTDKNVYPISKSVLGDYSKFCKTIDSNFEFVDNIILEPGEEFKNLESCKKIWDVLEIKDADITSIIINIGGGVITDIGGFAASTFKRGIDYINVPTTLLAMVDAAHGGKVGINYAENKNEIGVIKQPLQVIHKQEFLNTLPNRELRSGLFEIIKYALIRDANLLYILEDGWAANQNYPISRCAQIKNKITNIDPEDKGLRKILNFGHTIGHAIESDSIKHDEIPLSHGECVGIGMICESYIANRLGLLHEANFDKVVTLIKEFFGDNRITIPVDAILKKLKSDKKNKGNGINFSLITSIGNCTFDNIVEDYDIIKDSLIYFNTL